MVNELIKENGDREKLFDALRRYQSGQDLPRLLADMREILDDPSKLELFDHMRPLILLHHQVAYSQTVPSVPGVKVRIVRLRRTPHEALGFAVRGGLEHSVGVFVTDVKPGSQADRQGLMVGDEIMGVNGFTISEAIHEDVLTLIKSRDDIVLKVTHIGMLPTKEEATSDVKWKYTEKGAAEEIMPSDSQKDSRDLKIFVDSSGHHSLGCGILSGPPHLPGIFVERVRPGSLAEEVNLEPGDQILEVNGTAFHRITHKEAVLALVSSRQLKITIRKGVGIPLMKQIPDMESAPTIRNESSSSSSSWSSSIRNGDNVATPPVSVSPAPSRVTNHTNNNNNNNNDGGSSSHQGASESAEEGGTADNESRKSRSPSLVTTQAQVHSDQSSSPSPSFPSSSPSPSPSSPSTSSPGPSSHHPPSSSFAASLYLNDIGKSRDLPSSSPPSSSTAASMTTKTKTTTTTTMRTSSGDKNDDDLREQLRKEIKSRLGSNQNSPLSGAAAIMEQRRHSNKSSGTPDLLGCGQDFDYSDTVSNRVYDMFSAQELDGRPLHSLVYNKHLDLGIGVEGGLGSPLNGRILVAMVFDEGVAKKSGKMRVGDQLMRVNSSRLVDVTVTKAHSLLEDAASSNAQVMTELIFCPSTLVNEEESMTYF